MVPLARLHSHNSNLAEFTHAFGQQFGPFAFEDCTESLFKLRQSGTLKEYILDFLRLTNTTTEVGPLLLKSYFLVVLKQELRYNVKLLKPTSVHNVIAIAVQVDAKLHDLKHVPTRLTPPLKPQPLAFKPRALALPYKKLTPDEV